ncbi:MAG: glycosyltransferase family 2 protein [Betaproteobacteria bacterium]|nr:glycosyltransferase family 2 protein [Betaproteobacteria bacterium]
MNDPIIVCPYVDDGDVDEVRRAFGLDEARGRDLPVFMWKDERQIGPERAYEYCWRQFPSRDVVILHTDMSPMPDDRENRWYRDLLERVRALPDVGMVACDLLYPLRGPDGSWYVQCAGGYFRDGAIEHIGGGVDVASGRVEGTARRYDDALRRTRAVEWVTFGGVYIRREVIEECGGFDERYHWAYVMDVDYSLEVRQRGFKLYQVPVNLLHYESKTTRKAHAADPRRYALAVENSRLFYQKWSGRMPRFDDGGVSAES